MMDIPKGLWKFVEKHREEGVMLTDEEVDDVYNYCLRKMEVVKVENPEEYIFLLYPNELNNYLFRRTVNTTTIQRMIGGKKECVQYAK